MRQARPLRPNSSVVEQETTNNGRTNRSAAAFPAQIDAITALIGGLLSGPRPFSAARRSSGAYLCDSAVLPHAAHGWTAPRCSETPAKSQASPRSDGRLFFLEFARVAATGRRTPRGPRFWRIPRAQLGEDRWPRRSDAVAAAPEIGGRGTPPTHTNADRTDASNRTHPPVARRSGC